MTNAAPLLDLAGVQTLKVERNCLAISPSAATVFAQLVAMGVELTSEPQGTCEAD